MLLLVHRFYPVLVARSLKVMKNMLLCDNWEGLLILRVHCSRNILLESLHSDTALYQFIKLLLFLEASRRVMDLR